MSKDMNIIELACEAGMPIDDDSFIFQATRERVTRFAALVRAAALEEAIDVVAFHGGSVEIEAAIRELKEVK